MKMFVYKLYETLSLKCMFLKYLSLYVILDYY